MPSYSEKGKKVTLKAALSAPKPAKKKVIKPGRKEEESRTMREIFANLSPWGYTKLLMALFLFAGVVTWGATRFAHHRASSLRFEKLEQRSNKKREMGDKRLNELVGQLAEKYELSFGQRRKAREIYFRYCVTYQDEWAKAMMQDDNLIHKDFRAILRAECDEEFKKILDAKQLRKFRDAQDKQNKQ